MLIGSFKYFFEMDQSASSIAYLGQIMLVTLLYVNHGIAKKNNMGFDQSES